jgi:hypothetical protein
MQRGHRGLSSTPRQGIVCAPGGPIVHPIPQPFRQYRYGELIDVNPPEPSPSNWAVVVVAADVELVVASDPG